MAVPKRKTSKSKRNMRRSHDALKKVNVIIDSKTGEYRLPHQMSDTDGTYNNRQIFINNSNEDEQTEDETKPETL